MLPGEVGEGNDEGGVDVDSDDEGVLGEGGGGQGQDLGEVLRQEESAPRRRADRVHFLPRRPGGRPTWTVAKPVTSLLSSSKKRVTSTARGRPMLDGSRKKLLPTSDP